MRIDQIALLYETKLSKLAFIKPKAWHSPYMTYFA
ncbi:hypothetical protein Leryth_016465 [Lithospermum erythrorhizon]|nr:hypothetical protein Leryth_016465 [Lithospermum erythrorhizon]